MPTATTTAPPKADTRLDPHRDYLVEAFMGDERSSPYKGTSAHQEFNGGRAQVLAIPDHDGVCFPEGREADNLSPCQARVRDLQWFVNAPGYVVSEAEFLRMKRGAVVIEGGD